MAPLHDAARNGDVEAISRILDASANPDALIDKPDSRMGWTAIHVAAVRGRVEAVKLLVERGAYVDKPNLNLLTPLQTAVQQHRNYEIVHALVVDGGANVLQRNHANISILDMAEKARCEERILTLLREHAAQQQAEVDAKKEEQKRKRAEAAAKRKAEREANGGKAPKKKKGSKKNTSAAAKKTVPQPEEVDETEKSDAATNPTKDSESSTDKEDQPNSNPSGDEKAGAKEEEDSKPAAEDEPIDAGRAEAPERMGDEAPEQVDGEDKDEGAKNTENDEKEEETDEPFPFLKFENKEVIGAVKLMVVREGTTVVREESVGAYTQQANNDADESVSKVMEAAKKLTKQLESWSPDQPAFGFYIPPEEVEAGREKLTEATNNNAAIAEKPQTGALLAHGLLEVKDNGNQMEAKIKQVAHSRKTAWTNRYYFSDGRVHTKTLAKVKAATNALKAQTVKNTISEVKFYTGDRSWYWETVLLVGECKKVPGALFGIKFDCFDQEHLHHGR